MGNPHDFREVMKAAFGFSDRSVEDVLAEQKQRDSETSSGGSRKTPRKAPTTDAKPRQSEVDKLAALMANAKPRPDPVSE